MNDFYKTVTDPVHGNIGLTQVEADVMTSALMQRLHNVRQLGLAHLVYPGANYSRFSHSIGACHNAGRLLNAIGRNSGKKLEAKEAQEYRIVALLHDVGHYPFSHATEHVVENFYAESLLGVASSLGAAMDSQSVGPAEVDKPISVEETQKHPPPPSYRHEPLGEMIIRSSPELSKILRDHNLDPEVIADKFSKSKPDPLIGIISSDLDCDRLDYLKRTALNSGAPYGSVDTGFLIDQATTDSDGIFCFNAKAARAADHLLVARYFDYMQVPFNKTVVALEWSLVNCLRELLKKGLLDCSGAEMHNKVMDGSWNHFDDQKVFELFRKLSHSIVIDSADTSVIRDHLAGVLDRRPAKMIAGWDEICSNREHRTIAKNEFIAKRVLDEAASEFSLDPQRLHVWTTPVYFSKADGSIDSEHQSEERIAEAVQLLDSETGKATLLVSRQDTLVHHLSALQMAGLRLYYLPENGELDPVVKQGLVKRFSDALGKPVM